MKKGNKQGEKISKIHYHGTQLLNRLNVYEEGIIMYERVREETSLGQVGRLPDEEGAAEHAGAGESFLRQIGGEG